MSPVRPWVAVGSAAEERLADTSVIIPDEVGVHGRQVGAPGSGGSVMMAEPVEGLASLAAQRLARLAERVECRQPTKSDVIKFDLEWTADPKFQSAVDAALKSDVGRGVSSLYEFVGCDASIYDRLKAAFVERPRIGANVRHELKYSLLMGAKVPRALYVGSGRDLPARMGQHLGRIGGAGTYSMRLAPWAAGLTGATELGYRIYPRDMDAIELGALEQELWDVRTPLLGKRSGR